MAEKEVNVKRKIAKNLIHLADRILDGCIISGILLMLCYGGYALWDTYQIEQTASAEKFQTYRPDTGQDSFDSLKKENPEVIGWITVPDTEIDYPIVQAADNSKYLNTDVKGEFALCGSIFLDYRNASDFSDVNSVIYGHYMQKESMFGDLKLFADEEFFQTHCYGELYFNGQWHTLELFSFCEVDAYQKTIYDVKKSPEEQAAYLKNLEQISMYFRKLDMGTEEHFVSLSTCIPGKGTDGRYVLTGRITDRPVTE